MIAKGGQEATTIGKHNGSVLRISADGRQATVLGYGLRQPQHQRQHPHRPRHRERPAGPLHSEHAAAHRARPAVLRVPERQAAAGESIPRRLPTRSRGFRTRSTRRRCRRSGCSTRGWARSTTGSCTSATTSRSSFACCSTTATREAAGRGREHHARVRLSAAQRLGESRRRPALHRGLPDHRLGDDGDAPSRPRPRALHRAPVHAAVARSSPMDKGVLAALRRGARSRRRPPNPDNYSRHELELQADLPVRLAAVQGGRHAGHRPARAKPRVPVEGRPQRLHRRAGHEAGDADARRLVARDGRRARRSRTAPTSRRTSCRRSIRAAEGFRRHHRRSVAESRGRRRRPRRSRVEEGRRVVSALRLHRVPRDREPRTVTMLGPTWKGLYGSERTYAKGGLRVARRRRLSAGIDPRAGGEDRRRLRAR